MITPVNFQPSRRAFGNQRAVPAILLCLAVAACGGPDRPVGVVGHVTGFAGLVAGDEPRAVLVGRDVLSAGGSPADAAVAMAFTMSVTLPSQASLGAGGVCMVYDNTKKKTEVLDFIANPPERLGAETTRPSAIPAMPRGLFALHAKYGKLRWEALLAPAESMARLGVPVSRAFSEQLAPVAGRLFEDAEARRSFSKSGGQHLEEGDSMVQEDLGATLSRFRQRGVGDFYSGTWAKEIVAAANAAGGSLTVEELRAFEPKWKQPLVVPYGDDTAYFPPPLASGGALEAELWAVLARDGAYARASDDEKPHLLAEAYARVFADRQHWLQPDGSSSEAPDALLSKDHLAAVMTNYKADAHETQQGDVPTDIVAGTGIVAINVDGSAVACNFSLNNPFGIGRVAPGTGILLGAASGIKGRGPYGLGPMLAVNTNSNEFRFAAAAGGGPTAPTAVVQTALDALIGNRSAADAVAAKRLHASAAPDVVFVEPGHAKEEALKARGHEIKESLIPSRVNAIKCTSGDPTPKRCSVGSDPRGPGLGVLIGKD